MKEQLVVYALKYDTPLINHILIVITNYTGSRCNIGQALEHNIYDIQIGRRVCKNGVVTINSEEGQRCCRLLHKADEIVFLNIEADLEEIVSAWMHRDQEMMFCYVKDNCADMLNWFLETYTDVPSAAACSRPVTCDHVCCCCWLPSFFSCCTLPDRVMKSLAYHVEEPQEMRKKL